MTITLLSKTLPPSKPITLSVKKLSLNDNKTPLALFTPLADKPWSIWLDSGQSEHIDSCFDILVWQPLVTLCTLGKETRVHHIEQGRTYVSDEDPLSLLEKIQQQVLEEIDKSALPDDKQHLPFLGGSLGYFAYDLGRRFETLPTKAKQDINIPEMAVGIYSQAVVFDHKRQEYFLICPENKRQEIETELQVLMADEENIIPSQHPFALMSNWQSNMTKSSYTEKFNRVQAYLLSGDSYQINLAQRFDADYQGSEFQAYCALRRENNAPFSAFIHLENAAILSVSPERFLHLSQGKVQSKPIKGTMPRDKDKIKDKQNATALQNSSKDRAENVMIVDLLRNDISKVCIPNTVVVPKLFDIESFSAVHHLVSTVEGQLLKKHNANSLMRASFPGGSITGAPKIRAMEIIEQLEPHRRSVYCGSIGYISTCGTMDTSITIRTLVCEKTLSKENTKKLQKGKIYCWAGGGLVADSTVDSEYQETFDKVHHILPILSNMSKNVGGKINEKG